MPMNKRNILFLINIVALLCIGGFLFFILRPYYQMHRWFIISEKIKNNPSFEFRPDDVFNKKTLATQIILTYLLTDNQIEENIIKTSKYDTILGFTEKYANSYKYPNMYFIVARAYDKKGTSTNDKKLNEKAKIYYEKALKLFPQRQEYLFPYAFNFVSLGDFESAKKILETLYLSDTEFPDYNFYYGIYLINEGEKNYEPALTLMEKAFSGGFEIIDTKTVSESYSRLFMYFYNKGDLENLEKTAYRLSSIDNEQKDAFNKIYLYIKSTKQIPKLQFREE
jgi:tetratricopeptide (TPR) repeat protein